MCGSSLLQGPCLRQTDHIGERHYCIPSIHADNSNHHIIFPGLFVYISDIKASQDLPHTTPLLLPFSVFSLTNQERQSFLIICSLLWQIHFKCKMLWVFQHFSVVVLICMLMWHNTRRFVLKDLRSLCTSQYVRSKSQPTWFKEKAGLPHFLIFLIP